MYSFIINIIIGFSPLSSQVNIASVSLALSGPLCELGQGIFEASEPVGPGVMIPHQVHRVSQVVLGLGDEGTVDQLGLQPVNLQVINLQAAVLAVSRVKRELSWEGGAAVQIFSPGIILSFERLRPLQKGSNSTQVTLVPQEVGLDLPLGPVVDGEGDRVKADRSVSEEEAPEVNPGNLVEHGIETGDLTDVVTDDVQQTPRYVGLAELPLLSAHTGAVQLQHSTVRSDQR